eukprot:5992507-Pleurochrysis_carterae.AAC.1
MRRRPTERVDGEKAIDARRRRGREGALAAVVRAERVHAREARTLRGAKDGEGWLRLISARDGEKGVQHPKEAYAERPHVGGKGVVGRSIAMLVQLGNLGGHVRPRPDGLGQRRHLVLVMPVGAPREDVRKAEIDPANLTAIVEHGILKLQIA